jgi:hypothetical protein
MRRGLAAVVLAPALAVGLAPGRAHAEDELTGPMAAVGILGWSVPSCLAYMVLHEGSHALAGKAVGAEVASIRLRPGSEDGVTFLAATRLEGEMTDAEAAFVTIAPILTDLTLLLAYGLLYELDALPANEHVRLPLVMLAMWPFSDLTANLIPAPIGATEVEELYDHWELGTWGRLPLRLLHAGLIAVSGYYLMRGLDGIGDRDDAPDAGAMAGFTF